MVPLLLRSPESSCKYHAMPWWFTSNAFKPELREPSPPIICSLWRNLELSTTANPSFSASSSCSQHSFSFTFTIITVWLALHLQRMPLMAAMLLLQAEAPRPPRLMPRLVGWTANTMETSSRCTSTSNSILDSSTARRGLMGFLMVARLSFLCLVKVAWTRVVWPGRTLPSPHML